MTSIRTLSPDISAEEQYEILSRGSVDLINKEEFLSKLKLERPLKIKAGFDPSRPDLHLGHSIVIHKLRQFQDLGHEVFFIVGDFTACIGDPSGQNKTRPALSFEEVKKGAETYKEQAAGKNFKITKRLDEDSQKVLSFFKRLDPKKTKLVYNSKWLEKIDLKDFILNIASKFTVARHLERNDFSLRYKSKKPIFLHEFFYPVLQAYDSKELKADVELGGTDQLFNLLLGRDMQEHFNQSPQVVLTLPLLEGIDAKQSLNENMKRDGNWNADGAWKMSKSLNNAVSFNDSPKDIYGKIMKISDDLLARYWDLFTEGERREEDLKNSFLEKSLHPKKEKEKLAWALVCSLYGEAEADKAQEEFMRVFSKRGLPDHIPEYQDSSRFEKIGICELIKKTGLSSSNSEARRGILSGAVKKDGEKITDPQITLDLSHEKNQDFILSFGKRKFKRINLKWEDIHELKVLLAYKRVCKENGDKEKLCEALAEDEDFKKAKISLNSIKLKFENNRFLDTGNRGLGHYSKRNKEIFNDYKNISIEELEEKIKSIKQKEG